jgi:hypothetical protein
MGFSIISEIPTIDTEIDTKAIIIAVGSTSDFCTENEKRIPISPIAASTDPTIVCNLRPENIAF